VTVSGCRFSGIDLAVWEATLVEGCLVRTVGREGILAWTVKGSVAWECGNTGIWGNQVSDSDGESINGNGLNADTIAQNCQGTSSSGYGLYARAAQNCRGYSSNNYGLYATHTALNCYGSSYSGGGLYAETAQNCRGYSSGSGYGLYAYYTALNCYGYSSSGPAGLYARNASFCTGYRSGGRAIWANMANGCWAIAGTNSITYKYNMP